MDQCIGGLSYERSLCGHGKQQSAVCDSPMEIRPMHQVCCGEADVGALGLSISSAFGSFSAGGSRHPFSVS